MGLIANFLTCLIYHGNYLYTAAVPYNMSRGHYLLRKVGGGDLLLIFQHIYFCRVTIYPAALSHNISRGHYLPCKINCPALDCIKAIFPIKLLTFCHDIANI